MASTDKAPYVGTRSRSRDVRPSALKVTAAAGGSALAGALIGHGSTLTLVIAGVAVLIAVTASLIDRRIAPAADPGRA